MGDRRCAGSRGKGKLRGGLKRGGMPAGLQDSYLSEIKRQGVPVTIYLINGFQLRGTVTAFDPFTISLEYERKTHLVYKHAVSTISPQGPFAAQNVVPPGIKPASNDSTAS